VIHPFSRFLSFVYLLEAGLLLVVVPWTVFWERNYFVEGTLIGEVLKAHVVRGAISGLGLVCLVAATAELRGLWPGRRNGGLGGAEPPVSLTR
jgi:hypothetical protein